MNEREKACLTKIIEHLDEAGWLMKGLQNDLCSISEYQIQNFINDAQTLAEEVRDIRQQL
jgi:hypothetical protein